MRHRPKEVAPQDKSKVSQRVFLAFLMMEVVLRLLAGRASFFFGPDRYWNLFDVIILLASFINILGNGMSFGHVRLLRVTRLTRLARSVQVAGMDGLGHGLRCVGTVHVRRQALVGDLRSPAASLASYVVPESIDI